MNTLIQNVLSRSGTRELNTRKFSLWCLVLVGRLKSSSVPWELFLLTLVARGHWQDTHTT